MADELTLEEYTAAQRTLQQLDANSWERRPRGLRRINPTECPLCLGELDLIFRSDGFTRTYRCPKHGEWLPSFDRGSGVLTFERPSDV